ncbi:Hypothetical Protein FCC1311_037682 [Hondaea fermentalgiana]|uniref:Uncharacterized protein n=1 Tax=Hondaea fermentalgiana TaxID=2315210 RepID=A0A2R5GAD2_9STRA|nr:Hypothetical Protein FCC1311_037682 [Hondaea fermentalgiana]|eukprot:GBG27545.1 Hypothetical Protein FCC1311_037682 [Hondaea fermentalgiana]
MGWGDLPLEGDSSDEDGSSFVQMRPRLNTVDAVHFPSRRSSLEADSQRSRAKSYQAPETTHSYDDSNNVRTVLSQRERVESVVQSESERNIHVAFEDLRVVTHPETGEVFKTRFSTYVVVDPKEMQSIEAAAQLRAGVMQEESKDDESNLQPSLPATAAAKDAGVRTNLLATAHAT